MVVQHEGLQKFRHIPIFAFTESRKIRRQLNLVWGVRSVRLDELFDTDKSVELMKNYLKDNGQVKKWRLSRYSYWNSNSQAGSYKYDNGELIEELIIVDHTKFHSFICENFGYLYF